MRTAPRKLKEVLRISKRVKNTPANYRLEEHSGISTCRFPIRQTLKAAARGSDGCNDDFVFTKTP